MKVRITAKLFDLCITIKLWKGVQVYNFSTFKPRLGLKVGIICIQEPFLGKKNLAHRRFILYWPAGAYDCKDKWVLIAIRKDLLNKIIVKNQTDLVSHPCNIMLDITKRQIHTTSQRKRTGIVDIYDNKLGKRQTWEDLDQKIRWAIQNISWKSIIR